MWQYLLTELGLILKLSQHISEADDGTFKGSTTPMVDLGICVLKDLNTGKLYLKNRLPMLTSKKYMSQNMYTLPLNGYV